MASLLALTQRFENNERPVGDILDPDQILALAIAAANYYAGYGALAAQLAIPVPVQTSVTPVTDVFGGFGVQLINYGLQATDTPTPLDPVTYGIINPPAYPAIDGTTDITVSEWAVIRPLFLLYVERETALQLEASRGMGIDPFGRSSGEIDSDIERMEQETIPFKAFGAQVVITI